jgi:predicted MFS family arabinose efflux permease
LIDERQLVAAKSLNALCSNLAGLIGPALGGMLARKLGLEGITLVQMATLLALAVMVGLIALPIDLRKVQVIRSGSVVVWTAVWRDWLDGLRLIGGRRIVAVLLAIAGVPMLGQGIINVLWMIFVKKMLAGGEAEYGWVQVAVAAGALLGGLMMGRWGRRLPSRWLIVLSSATIGLLLLATFNWPSLPAILCLQFLLGIPAVGFSITTQTLLQSNVQNRCLGRISGAQSTTNTLLVLVGQATASVLGDRLGLVPMLNLSGALCFVSAAIALVMLRRVRHVTIARNSS